jgi:hypothetical protein
MDGEHVTPTDFRYHGAHKLMDYCERKKDYTLKNRTGQEMSEQEKEAFEAKSEYHQFERHTVLSPREDRTDKEMGEMTRDSINQYFDGESVDFCYAVHRDAEEGVHAHVVLTGEKDDLYMNKSDIREFNDQSKERFRERERSIEREIRRENGMEQEREQEQEKEQEQTIDRQRTIQRGAIQ